MEKMEKQTAGEKITAFLEKNRKGVVSVFIVVVVFLLAFVVVDTVTNKSKVNNLALLDEVTYVLTKDALNADDAELSAKKSAAMESVKPLLGKGGIVGARANYLAGEIEVLNGNYADALKYYETAAAKAKKNYLGTILVYNCAYCYEMTGDMDKAIENYKLASADADFLLRAHAQFSVGRIYESMGKNDEAVAAYEELVNRTPNLEWAKIAKSRILALDVAKKSSR